ncbi:hypothetical protein HOG21_04605 [bacterium]|jgi:hypothetical protein|nr:hypothetical protein [bacterium]
MNNIYKCALLSIQEKSLELIKKDLINKNKNLANKVSNKISSKMHRIQMSFSRFNCKKNNSYDLQKLNVLHQASYQTCKYVIYLEYLKEYNNKLSNLTNNDKNSYTNSELIELQRNEILEIEKEIEHTYKVFPLAYHAYTEYENNITTHFLLELLREDYIVFKEKLHKVLNPINQVVYKISNAMRK